MKKVLLMAVIFTATGFAAKAGPQDPLYIADEVLTGQMANPIELPSNSSAGSKADAKLNVEAVLNSRKRFK